MTEKFPDSHQPPHDSDSMTQSYYDYLTAEDPIPDLSPLTASQESFPDPRLMELFAPRLTRQEDLVQQGHEEGLRNDYYNKLVEDTSLDEQQQRYDVNQRNHDRVMRTYTTEPTVDTKLEAFRVLQEAKRNDPTLGAIVDKYIPMAPGIPDYDRIVDEVRKNFSLRYEVGSYLLRDKLPRIKQEDPHSIPYRVYVNGEKSPNHRGYGQFGKVTSQQYATMIAISMLDGTFAGSPAGDEIVVSRDKPDDVLGQHRLAAARLLEVQVPYELK